MPFSRRINFMGFIENQKAIERNWDERFGDRRIELVFIGQEMDEAEITEALDACLATEQELGGSLWKLDSEDRWPVPRAVPPMG